eukprot:522794-Rhodomonas_salina.3
MGQTWLEVLEAVEHALDLRRLRAPSERSLCGVGGRGSGDGRGCRGACTGTAHTPCVTTGADLGPRHRADLSPECSMLHT